MLHTTISQGQNEFLGIVTAKPTVRLERKPLEHYGTKLGWYAIDRHNQYAGDLLAAFELVSVGVGALLIFHTHPRT